MGQFTNALGTQPSSIQNLVRRLVATLHPDQVILFGSRARGTHRANSDFDIAVKARHLDRKKWRHALLDLEETPVTLYPVDLLHYEELSDDYRKNIDQEGIALYA